MHLPGQKYGPCFFKVPDPKKISGQPEKLDIRVQIDWATMFARLQYVPIEMKTYENRIKFRVLIRIQSIALTLNTQPQTQILIGN